MYATIFIGREDRLGPPNLESNVGAALRCDTKMWIIAALSRSHKDLLNGKNMTSLDPQLYQYDKIVSLTGYASLQDHAPREHDDTRTNPMVGMIAALRR